MVTRGRRRLYGAWWLVWVLPWVALAAQAEIRVDVQGVDGDIKRNVLLLLSVERYKDRARVEPEAVERLYRRADEEVRTALRPFGYYDPDVRSSIQGPDAEHRWQVTIRIGLGEPIRLGNVVLSVQGPGAEDPAFKRLLANATLHPGDRLQHVLYDGLKEALIETADNFGYFDARLLRSEMKVMPQQHRADVALVLDTGERYRFGETTIEQKAVRARDVQRFLRYRAGEPFDQRLLLRTQFALSDSLYFASVDVVRGRIDHATHIVPITIKASSARRTYSIGPGYGTDTGWRITAIWTVPVVNTYGHRLRVQAELSNIQKAFDARYDIPFADPALDKLSLEAIGQTAQWGSNVSTTDYSIIPSVTQIKGHWQRSFALNFAQMVTEDPFSGTIQLRGTSPPQYYTSGRTVDNLLLPTVSMTWVPEGYIGESLLNRGLFIQLLGSNRSLGARADFLRLDVSADRAFQIVPLWHLLLRGEIGASSVSNVEDLPGQLRFYAGGDRSVRGFAINDLDSLTSLPVYDSHGALSVPSYKVGARDLIVGSTEVERDLPKNLGVALFVDGGNAINHFSDPLGLSVGIGLRLRSPVLTMGLDVAKSLRAPGYPDRPGPRLNLNISGRL